MDDSFLASSEAPGNVILDVDGVLLLGGEPIPGATDAVRALGRAGLRLLFATNNSTRTAVANAERLSRLLEVEIAPDRVVTSAIAATRLLGTDDDPVLVVGEEGLEATLKEYGRTLTPRWQDAASVVAGLDQGITYERLAAATRAIRAGARFVGTNGDLTFPVPGGQVPGAGALLAALEAATGVSPEVAGKPNAAMRQAITDRLGPGPVWMVGDRPETDLAMASAAGWDGVLVLSGVAERAADSRWDPRLVLDSIAGLPSALGL